MVRDKVDRHPKLKRGDSKTENLNKPTTIDSNNIYEKVFEYEEHEALSRTPDNDVKLFKETCDRIRELIKTIGELKSKNEPSNPSLINEYRVDASTLFLMLKKLNRLEKFRLNNGREKLHETKRQVDNLHLQWQNLLYETHHLKKEISNCLSFKSKDEHIDLISIEEFYENAPQSISRPDVTKKDPHQQRLARLEWELSQRKILAETCHDVEEEKEQISLEIKRKKDRIENLVPMIKNILTVTKPVQEHLGLPMSQLQSEPELVQLLPPPLYFLSIQANAMREALDSLIKLTIIGDKDAAARVNTSVTELITVEDTDSDDDRKNHHHRRKTKSQIREEKIKRLLLKHPLSVKLDISLKDGSSISIVFHHLINLKIISVIPTAHTKSFEGLCCRNLLESRNILNGLFDEDNGEFSPNFANSYQLEQLGIEYNTFDLGIPYLWAQKLCGLDFTGRTRNIDNVPNPRINAEQRNMLITGRKIRQHFRSVIDLCEQLQDMENLVTSMKFREITSYPVKVACTLSKWGLLPWEQFSSNPCVKYFEKKLTLTQYDRYFHAVLVRNAAKLFTFVIVKPNYPATTPIFSVQIENGGKTYTAENNNNIRDMEKEINFHVDELLERLGKQKNWLLTAQFNKLAVCFDIFLECTDRENFPREKLFYHYVRGRTRSLPFKYVMRGSEGLFVQR